MIVVECPQTILLWTQFVEDNQQFSLKLLGPLHSQQRPIGYTEFERDLRIFIQQGESASCHSDCVDERALKNELMQRWFDKAALHESSQII